MRMRRVELMTVMTEREREICLYTVHGLAPHRCSPAVTLPGLCPNSLIGSMLQQGGGVEKEGQ